jgi:lipopolysaccharide export system permease protein
LLNTLGEKLAKEGVITPFGGMWLASMLLLPVGIFLTYKALNDSQLMNKEFYYRTYTRIKKWWNIKKQQRKDDKISRQAEKAEA